MFRNRRILPLIIVITMLLSTITLNAQPIKEAFNEANTKEALTNLNSQNVMVEIKDGNSNLVISFKILIKDSKVLVPFRDDLDVKEINIKGNKVEIILTSTDVEELNSLVRSILQYFNEKQVKESSSYNYKDEYYDYYNSNTDKELEENITEPKDEETDKLEQEEPVEPSKPEVEEPEVPEITEQPEDPEDKDNDLEEPGKDEPKDPDEEDPKPVEPENPEQPEVPEEPGDNEQPEQPEVPEEPSEPECQELTEELLKDIVNKVSELISNGEDSKINEYVNSLNLSDEDKSKVDDLINKLKEELDKPEEPQPEEPDVEKPIESEAPEQPIEPETPGVGNKDEDKTQEPSEPEVEEPETPEQPDDKDIEDEPVTVENRHDKFNKGQGVSHDKIREVFLNLINEERATQNIAPLTYDERLKQGTELRSQELADFGSIRTGENKDQKHKRPNGKDLFRTAFDYMPNYENDKARYLGENLASLTYLDVEDADMIYSPLNEELFDEAVVAKMFFDMWKSSPGHYKNFMGVKYKSMWLEIRVSQEQVDYDFGDGPEKARLIVGTQILSTLDVEVEEPTENIEDPEDTVDEPKEEEHPVEEDVESPEESNEPEDSVEQPEESVEENN